MRQKQHFNFFYCVISWSIKYKLTLAYFSNTFLFVSKSEIYNITKWPKKFIKDTCFIIEIRSNNLFCLLSTDWLGLGSRWWEYEDWLSMVPACPPFSHSNEQSKEKLFFFFSRKGYNVIHAATELLVKCWEDPDKRVIIPEEDQDKKSGDDTWAETWTVSRSWVHEWTEKHCGLMWREGDRAAHECGLHCGRWNLQLRALSWGEGGLSSWRHKHLGSWMDRCTETIWACVCHTEKLSPTLLPWLLAKQGVQGQAGGWNQSCCHQRFPAQSSKVLQASSPQADTHLWIV